MKLLEHVSLKVNRDGTNSRLGDRNNCSYCHKRIFHLYKFLNNSWLLIRTNRVDTGGGRKRVRSYHLGCYDMIIFGGIRHNTINRVKKIYTNAVIARNYQELIKMIDFFA